MSSLAPPQPPRLRSPLLSKPAGAVLTAGLLIAAAYVIPGAERFRLLSAKEEASAPVAPAASDHAAAPVGEAQLVDETGDHPELAIPENAQLPALHGAETLPAAVHTKAPPVPIDDPSGHALDAFFASLLRVERKQPKAISRVLHYGDSLLAIDYVAGTLRRKLQERFGDAGHGYMPIANPWPGYFHNDVIRRASTEWSVSRVVGPFAEDNLYGLGGVSFIGRTRAAWSQFATSTRGPVGHHVSRFAIQYLQQPGGGTIALKVDKGSPELFDTNGDQRLATVVHEVPDGEHTFELQVQKGPVRAFGAWMERDVPGVVLDSVGIQGCRIRFLDKADDAHWAEALRARNPDLVVFEFGLNEAADGFAYPMDRYKETALAVLRQVRVALPQASCLVVAPNDTAKKNGTVLGSRPIMPHLVTAQREVAHQAGCAFFDTYEAMGGLGSMPTWVGRGLGGADLTHPTAVGADVIGTWLHGALMNAYSPWREAALRAGEPSASPGTSDSSTPTR